MGAAQRILIHTSVKLVTEEPHQHIGTDHNFNPHEREARDDVNPADAIKYIVF